MQLFKLILPRVILLLVSLASFSAEAARSREIGSQKNVYVTEWSKLKHKAELGDPIALFTLGNFYFEPPKGSSFRRNYKKAAELYFQASIRQYPSAQYNIGIMLHNGIGFKIDKVESYVWFYFASINKSPVAKGVNKKSEDIVNQLKRELTEAQLTEANKRIEFYQRIIGNKRYREARIPERK